MKKFLFATSNPIKVRMAENVATEFGFRVQQIDVPVLEIQDEDGEVVARDKAYKVFDKLQKPVITCDDAWLIPGLQNFPGPYMKSVNHWFTPQNWLDLTRDLADRRIILRQYVVYQDVEQQKLFFTDLEGILLKEARGNSLFPHMALTSFDGGKTSSAEVYEKTKMPTTNQRTSWHDLCEWLTENPA